MMRHRIYCRGEFLFKALTSGGLVLLFFLLMVSCSQEPPESVTTSDGSKQISEKNRVVATVGQGNIYEDELRHYVEARRVRPDKDPHEIISGMLKELTTGEALYQEAVQAGLDQDPAIRQNIRQMLGQALLEKEVIQPILSREIAEEELKQYYQAHLDEFSRPEQVRLADIFIAVPEKASAEERQNLKKKAENILQEAKSNRGIRFSFSELVKKYSDKHPLYQRGDTGFFDKEGKPSGLDDSMVDAAFNLNRAGDVYDEVVHSPDGFHIIMLVARQQGYGRDFAQVKRMLEQRIRKEELAAKRSAYISGLVARTKPSVSDDVLQEFVDDVGLTMGAGHRRNADLPDNTRNHLSPPGFPGQ